MTQRQAWIGVLLAAAALTVGTSDLLAKGRPGMPAPGVAARGRPEGTVAVNATELRQDMRKLWSDHVIWTREYVVAAIDGSPDLTAATNRLLRNQEDIGRAIVPFYGEAAGRKLTDLLKQHILIAVDVVAAAKTKDKAAYAESSRRWEQNADEIADFLSGANPNWPKSALSAMMHMHLATTTREVVARLNKTWDDDVAAFDEVYAHILRMADALTDGIVKQFGGRA